jgi:hypothetical protein
MYPMITCHSTYTSLAYASMCSFYERPCSGCARVGDTFHMCSAHKSFPVRASMVHPSCIHMADPGISATDVDTMIQGEVGCLRLIIKRLILIRMTD